MPLDPQVEAYIAQMEALNVPRFIMPVHTNAVRLWCQPVR